MSGIKAVNVWSYRTNISQAKIRKYQLASERGISCYLEVRDPVPTLAVTPATSLITTPSSPGPSSGKRSRLRLRNSNASPAASAGTIVVAPSRPKRKHHFDLDKDMVFEDGITSVMEPEPVSSPEPEPEPKPEPVASPAADNSDGSALSSPPPMEDEALEDIEPTPEDLEYGVGFTSYYVIDDDVTEEAEKPLPAAKPRKPSKKPDPPKHAPAPSPTQAPPHPPTQAPAHAYLPRSHQSPSRPSIPPAQHALPPLQGPVINFIDDIRRNIDPTEPPPIAVIIEKLKTLSAALVKFGAGEPASKSTQDQNAIQGHGHSRTMSDTDRASTGLLTNTHDDEPVDGLLAIFDESDESDVASGDESASLQGRKDIDYELSVPGTPDDALTYGVEFIMNALRTWAAQRMNAFYSQQWQHYNELRQRQLQQQPPPRKGRGRPSKADLEQRRAAQQLPPLPAVLNAELTHTPEGEAVQAFQDVLDCGVLRANGIIPKDLGEALAVLYGQIDRLINNNNNTDEQAPWQCMSYQAQIFANKVKVEKWKEHMANLQAEMARQRELSHQQLMHGMGVPPHLQHRGTTTQEQTDRQHAMSLELRRGQSQASSQPHLTQYITTPLELDTARHTVASPAAGSALNDTASNASAAIGNAANNPIPSRSREPMSAVTMYRGVSNPPDIAPQHGGLLRGGYKFQFTQPPPNNPDAVRLFGPEAFAPVDRASSIPRRGPMSKPIEQPIQVNGTNGRAQNSPLDAKAPSMPPPATRNGNGTPKQSTVSNSPSPVEATMANGVSNGHHPPNQKRRSFAQTAPLVQSPVNTHKRKLSDTVNGSASDSLPPKKCRSSALTAPLVKSPVSTHKRKFSETVDGSAPGSPLSKKRASNGDKTVTSDKKANDAMKLPTQSAIVVE